MTDLRVVKTRKNIREAFIELRSREPLEKMRVARLCKLALINKTTFYKHYQDIYALSEEIENETIQSIMSSIDPGVSLFTDPEIFLKGLYYAFKSHNEIIMTLFSGRMNILIDKVDRQMKTQYPPLSSMPEREIVLSFLIWGASHVLMESRYQESIMLDTLTRVFNQIILQIDEFEGSGE